eukprot:14938714-Alexandrium_andersonii.AAC.1
MQGSLGAPANVTLTADMVIRNARGAAAATWTRGTRRRAAAAGGVARAAAVGTLRGPRLPRRPAAIRPTRTCPGRSSARKTGTTTTS